jgi:hypothetical protein
LKSAAFFIGAYCKEFSGGLDTLFILRDHLILTKILHTKNAWSCRGLYALQGGESRPSSLSEGGSTGNQMRHRPVRSPRIFSRQTLRMGPFIPSIVLPFASVVSARCAKTVCNNLRRIGTAWK